MNYLWAFMILSGVIFSAFHGTIPAVTGAVLDSAKEAVTLCITMTGVMSFWMGLMRIAERGGVIAGLSRKLKPVLRFLFPQIPPEHVANEQIAANMIANIFGLGWAATPAGLKAMESLEELEESRRKEMEVQNDAAKRKKDYNNQKFQKPFYQIAEYHSDCNEKEGKSNYTLQTTSPPKKDFTYHYKICKVFFFYVCFIPLPVSMLLLPPVQSALLPLSFPS